MVGERRLSEADRSATRENATDAFGSAVPVRDPEMQPFTFEFVRVGTCDP
jgi:hypothetical protein